jgi:hypothetical protein
MYVFFEHHRDPSGQITLTELRLASYPDWLRIQFKNATENTAFEASKVLLKRAPVAARSYDTDLKVWSYLGSEWGQRTLDQLKAVISNITPVKFVEVEDLRMYAAVNRYEPNRKQEIKVEDFFYQQAPTVTVVSKESITVQLTKLLEISEAELHAADKDTLKKLYRRACLKLHPDRNNGNGAAMSELNMLWGIYNA